MATQTLKEVVCWLSQSIMHEAWKHQSLIALKNRYKFFSSGITDFVVTQLQINQALIFFSACARVPAPERSILLELKPKSSRVPLTSRASARGITRDELIDKLLRCKWVI